MQSLLRIPLRYGAELYFRIWDEFKKGDWAAVRADMDLVCEGVDLLVYNGGLAAGKALMGIRGIDCGDPRPPLMPLKKDIIKRIREKGKAVYSEDPAEQGERDPVV